MKKKDYISPAFCQIEINVRTTLLDASVKGVNMGKDFSKDLTVGGETTEADSRGSGLFWDDDY